MVLARALASLRSVFRDRRGVAYVEFAYSLPMFLTLMLGGAEISNYVTTKMRMSQLALHLADHAARIGTGSQLAAKTVSETQINDVLTGAGLQAGGLNLYSKGRVIISSLEPVANPNTTSRYKIGWQRCRGIKNVTSSYGNAGQTNMTGMGPAGRQVIAPDDSGTIFVELVYDYKPIISNSWAPTLTIREIASMPIRDRRDLTQVYNNEGAPQHLCSQFTTT
ncbi:TadE/TadG family type IV pilus assembly protein [Sphingomonas sp.]|uniref:TadE/TadG family type IV pilus assembly protein n=1 Tax=Sphingomonas sp. TaxID=28214 RepID=UPI002FCB5197